MRHALSFLQEFVKHPGSIGAVAPSSLGLAEEMMLQTHVSECKTLAEFGAGTGVFTKVALHTLPENSRFIAIEQNCHLVECLREELELERLLQKPPAWCGQYSQPPVFCDTVENLPILMQQNGIQQLDGIISGLPWATFSNKLQDDLLQVAWDGLKPGGYFCTFAYLQSVLLPGGQAFYKKINSRFSEVTKSRVIWRNIPPAFVYCCRK